MALDFSYLANSAGTTGLMDPTTGKPQASAFGPNASPINTAAFNDNNAGNVYNLIAAGLNNNAQTVSPIANLTTLGAAKQYGGASIASPSLYGGAQVASAQDQSFANAQAQFINQLNAQANGSAPSIAQMQAQQQAQQNIQGQMAMLASARGSSNPALAQRAAMDAGSQANQQAVQAGVLGKVQEQMNAENALNSALSTARGQGQNMTLNQAQLYQQAGLANQAAKNTTDQQQAALYQQAGLANAAQYNQLIGQQGAMDQQVQLANQQSQLNTNTLNNQTYANLLSNYMNQNQTDISNQAAYWQLIANQQAVSAQIDAKQTADQNAQNLGLAGAGISAAGAIGGAAIQAASDRRLKKAIKPAERTVRSFLNSLTK